MYFAFGLEKNIYNMRLHQDMMVLAGLKKKLRIESSVASRVSRFGFVVTINHNPLLRRHAECLH